MPVQKWCKPGGTWNPDYISSIWPLLDIYVESLLRIARFGVVLHTGSSGVASSPAVATSHVMLSAAFLAWTCAMYMMLAVTYGSELAC